MREEDLYQQLGKELQTFLKEFKPLEKRNLERVRHQMEKIEKIAKRIGGPLDAEAARLKMDLESFFRDPQNSQVVSRVQELALRLEQETREI